MIQVRVISYFTFSLGMSVVFILNTRASPVYYTQSPTTIETGMCIRQPRIIEYGWPFVWRVDRVAPHATHVQGHCPVKTEIQVLGAISNTAISLFCGALFAITFTGFKAIGLMHRDRTYIHELIAASNRGDREVENGVYEDTPDTQLSKVIR